MSSSRRRLSRAMPFVACSLVLALAACGSSGKDEQAAYDVCIVSARADKFLGKANFATKENSNIQASTGDAYLRVNIPYELDGKKGQYQCIAEKQVDNSFKVIN